MASKDITEYCKLERSVSTQHIEKLINFSSCYQVDRLLYGFGIQDPRNYLGYYEFQEL